MKIAIVHKNGAVAEIIKQNVDKFCKKNNIEVVSMLFFDGIDIASDYAADYDIIFLSCETKLLSVVKTCEIIRKKDRDIPIVLLSKSMQAAVFGYSIGAFGFLSEPIKYEDLQNTMRRFVNSVYPSNKRYILFSTENGMDRVAVDSIVYIESCDHRKDINTTDGVYFVYDTMTGLESRLTSNQFSRCNNSFLVNLAFIKSVHGEFVTIIGGREIKITRSKRKSFLQDVERYFGVKI